METILEINQGKTVGQIVADNFRAAEVFKKYGIDFCCKGGKLFTDVCREKKLDAAQIEHELTEKFAYTIPRPEDSLQNMPLDELVEHIQTTHHRYVRESIPALLSFLNKINTVHGGRHPELQGILSEFSESADELMHHMVKEETILFPAIKKLAEAERNNQSLPPFFFGKLINPISTMEEEHATEGARFARIVELSNNFTPPEDGCTTYRVAFMKLDEFMNDLFTHIHLENNILFPKAFMLEDKLVK
ncbi:MAG: iron-sulfur cluster repair di-iron protein [Flavipsychrobacter sp.]|jgi:regulator of cell morphogenesis and NO signaling|nr:iron-sulfur cluster repair di-iron protein [Flavipsychrobacter sp.]